MKFKPQKQSLWFGSFKFGVHVRRHNEQSGKMILFTTREEAEKEAKFALYNAEQVGVYDLSNQQGITGTSVLISTITKKLVKTI